MGFVAGAYDIAVVGAGHAGCEAALAAAKLGFRTVVFAVNLDSIANMACNPSIGGTAKGQLVREIDALGGIMGKIADKAAIQSKLLNKAKGPAVYSPRAQIDRRHYQIYMKQALEQQENLDVKQGEIVDLLTEDGPAGIPAVTGVITHTGACYKCKCAIICTGTYLKGKVIIGDISYSSGPDGQFPANQLSGKLAALGFTLIRLKTGTPARVNKRSIAIETMEPQYGDEKPFLFSYESSPDPEKQQIPCYLTYTNQNTHDVIKANLHRSPLYNGLIEGVGPRYCPSIEDKIVRFHDKERHQVFVEPMGRDTEEMYLQGLSSSLPEDVQLAFIRSIPGLEHASVMRPAYAIEYDAIDARQLKLSLESRITDGLFFAGQINGSSGYEEAGAQGLMAGINASRKLQGKPPLIIDRSEAYIGVLIDDLVTRGTREPYRMMTSRAEYRLLLRQDNADERLTEKGYAAGLISESRYQAFCCKQQRISREIERLKTTYAAPGNETNRLLAGWDSTPLKSGTRLIDLLRRPEITYQRIKEIEAGSADDVQIRLSEEEAEQVEIRVKYEGYIKRQFQQVEQFKKLEQKRLPVPYDYSRVPNISLEAREKLTKIQPESVGQASRITGVSPADITALMIYFNREAREK